MPIIVSQNLEAIEKLKSENIFVMNEFRAKHQDIRPLKIAIVNLMPTKITTEVQLLRLIANVSLQIDITLIHMKSHESKNTDANYLLSCYKTFDDIKNDHFDGMIITGAPVENFEFEDVDYWNELEQIMEYTKSSVTSTLHICWGAQAGLYYHYGIDKFKLDKKMFGVFEHRVLDSKEKLLRGFDDVFFAPHSRHTGSSSKLITEVDRLKLLAESEEAGAYLAISKNGKNIFVTGHSEYDPETLKLEYERDIKAGYSIDIPKNYFESDNPNLDPLVRWRSHGNLLFSNWLNYYVYQESPYIW